MLVMREKLYVRCEECQARVSHKVHKICLCFFVAKKSMSQRRTLSLKEAGGPR